MRISHLGRDHGTGIVVLHSVSTNVRRPSGVTIDGPVAVGCTGWHRNGPDGHHRGIHQSHVLLSTAISRSADTEPSASTWVLNNALKPNRSKSG